MIITVANHKGGVGKTTLAAHLAFFAAEQKTGRVLAVDLDAQANLTATFVARDDALSAANAMDLFFEKQPPAVMSTVDPNIDLLPACPALTRVDKESFSAAFLASDHLKAYATRYHTIVIDTPPVLGLRLSAALAASHRVFVPLIPEMYSVDGVSGLINEVNAIAGRLNPDLGAPEFVLNLLNPRARQHEEISTRLQSMFRIVRPFLYRHAAVSEALADMRPTWRRTTHSGAAREWREVCAALLGADVLHEQEVAA